VGLAPIWGRNLFFWSNTIFTGCLAANYFPLSSLRKLKTTRKELTLRSLSLQSVFYAAATFSFENPFSMKSFSIKRIKIQDGKGRLIHSLYKESFASSVRSLFSLTNSSRDSKRSLACSSVKPYCIKDFSRYNLRCWAFSATETFSSLRNVSSKGIETPLQ
jgi:hypothetical protein